MALVLADRVKVRSISTGTGAFTLASTVLGFQSFEAVGDGNETFYGIVDNQGNWEIGRGTYTLLTSSLSRDSIISSSNNDALVDFAAGGKNVFGTFPSSLAQSIVSSTVVDSFKTITVTGQSDVVAESSTDTLTLAAGSGITITTDSITDSVTIASSYDQTLNTTDSVTFNEITSTILWQNSSTTRSSNSVNVPGATPTVVFATPVWFTSIKLVIAVEGQLDSDGTFVDHTQTCEATIAATYNTAAEPIMSVYGIVYTSPAPLATFTVARNGITGQTEVTAVNSQTTNAMNVRIHAIQFVSRYD